MPGRELPASLREVLRRVRDVEAIARPGGQQRAAVAATSAWTQAELAAFIRPCRSG